MDNQKTTDMEEKEPKGKLWALFSNIELLAVAAAVVLLFFTFVGRITVVEGGSMEDTLNGGDKLVVSDLLYTPERGDIVIIQSPLVNDGNAIVKRIIALGGDTVEIRTGGVYVNGTLLHETDGSEGYTIAPSLYRYMSPIKVPEGEVFVLGDNRAVSLDSRSFGTVEENAIIGRVLFRLTPFSAFGAVD